MANFEAIAQQLLIVTTNISILTITITVITRTILVVMTIIETVVITNRVVEPWVTIELVGGSNYSFHCTNLSELRVTNL